MFITKLSLIVNQIIMSESKTTPINSSKAAKEIIADKASKNSATKEFYDEKAQQTRENLSKGGEPVTVDLVNKTRVQFTKDFGHIKKGHIQEVSDVAFGIYDKKGVIKKL